MTVRRNPSMAFVVLLGIGLLTSAYAIWTLETQVKQQQQTVRALIAQSEQDRQALSAQQRLTQALQQQVRQLGGEPILTPPAPEPTPPASRSSGAVPTTTPRPAASSPSPRPSPTPSRSHPSVSPSPTPSPSQTCLVKAGPLCL